MAVGCDTAGQLRRPTAPVAEILLVGIAALFAGVQNMLRLGVGRCYALCSVIMLAAGEFKNVACSTDSFGVCLFDIITVAVACLYHNCI